MKNFVISLLAITLIFLSGCHKKVSEVPFDNTVTVDSIHLQDSIIEHNCKIRLSLDVIYPRFYQDKASTQELTNLFCLNVLSVNMNDSTDIVSRIRNYMSSMVRLYSISEGANSVRDSDIDSTSQYLISFIIRPTFNRNGILCYHKNSCISKNGHSAVASNLYSVFDLTEMKRMTIDDLFESQDIPVINEMLINRLIEQENVNSAAQLIDLGYFNIDYIEASDNFCITNKGLCFIYNPYEIYALGETCIELDYQSIRQYLKKNSAIQKIINSNE